MDRVYRQIDLNKYGSPLMEDKRKKDCNLAYLNFIQVGYVELN